MTNYILLYKGPAVDMSKVSKEDFDASMAKWAVWMEKTGKSLVDVGAPMVNGVSIVDDGTDGRPSDLGGYSIVAAESIAEARKLVDGHPHLSEGKGLYSVEIFELTPIPMES